MEKYDLAVVGAGPGGYVAAIRAAQLGADICLIEKDKLGGTCLNWGCIPTKALTASCELVRQIEQGRRLGVKVNDYEIDWEQIQKSKDRKVNRLVKGIQHLIKQNQIDLIRGTASLTGTNSLQISGGEEKEITADNIILAAGSQPIKPAEFNYDGEQILTSRDILALENLPASLLIVGAGVIGCEFASIFAELGVEVTVVDIADRILPAESREISRELARQFKRKRIKVKTGVKIDKLEVVREKVKAQLETNDNLTAEKGLLAVGRKPNYSGLNLEAAGLKPTEGAIEVDNHLQTEVDSIYAIGDLTDKVQLAHVASQQGIVAVENIMGTNRKMNYHAVPNTIFTHPEVASVGYSEAEAAAEGKKVNTGKFFFKGNGKAVTINQTQGFVKVIAEAETGVVIGGEIVGPHAADLIHELALAVNNELQVEDLITTIHAHPTLSEAVVEASEDIVGRSIHGG